MDDKSQLSDALTPAKKIGREEENREHLMRYNTVESITTYPQFQSLTHALECVRILQLHLIYFVLINRFVRESVMSDFDTCLGFH